MSEKKLIIYTAIDGGHYTLKPQGIGSEIADFTCFTNKKFDSPPWEIKPIKNIYPNKRLNYKWYKMMPHKLFPEYEYSLWIDSLFVLRGNPYIYIDKYLKDYNLGIFRHNTERKCIYEEGEICIDLGLADKKITEAQLKRYKEDGYPKDNGLVMTGILFRKHNEPDVVNTMEHWFKEVQNGCKRDQVSFNYSAWKTNLNFKVFEEKQYHCECFRER